MKFKHTLSLLALATATAFSTSALAQTSTVTFKGEIRDTICTTAVAGNANTVTLPTVTSDTLDTAGKTSGQVDFPVVFTGCTTAGNYQAHFSSATEVNGRLPNATGTAANVSLQLLSANDTPVYFTDSINTTVRHPGDPGVDIVAGGDGTATYKVRYYAESPVTAGTVEATATMTISFL